MGKKVPRMFFWFVADSMFLEPEGVRSVFVLVNEVRLQLHVRLWLHVVRYRLNVRNLKIIGRY